MRAYVTRIPVAITLLLLAVLAASGAHAQEADSLPRLRASRFAGDTLRFALPGALGYLLPPRIEASIAAGRWS